MVARKRGVCTNCLRPDMALFGHDRCGSCGLAIVGVPKESWPTVLAAAKQKYQNKPKMHAGKKAKVEGTTPKERKSGAAVSGSLIRKDHKVEGKDPSEQGAIAMEKHFFQPKAERLPPLPIKKTFMFRIDVALHTERDKKLIETIKEISQAERRPVHSQVLYMLEKAMNLMTGESAGGGHAI